MRPKFYLDVNLQMTSHMNKHDTMSFAVQKLHHAMNVVGECALGFPGLGGERGLGTKVRVFSESFDVLSQVRLVLQEDWRMTEAFAFESVKSVPEIATKYEAYYRFRLSHGLSQLRAERLSSSGLAQKFINRNQLIREKQISTLHQSIEHIGFATIYSHSTGKQFKLYIVRRSCNSISEGKPDAYGLSRKTQVISLPVFP